MASLCPAPVVVRFCLAAAVPPSCDMSRSRGRSWLTSRGELAAGQLEPPGTGRGPPLLSLLIFIAGGALGLAAGAAGAWYWARRRSLCTSVFAAVPQPWQVEIGRAAGRERRVQTV